MRRAKSGKVRASTPRIVAVIAAPGDLARATRLRRAPDLFELRLDAFADATAEIDAQRARLRAPLIVTARHAAEGGTCNLTTAERRSLLLRFLPVAEYVDLEFRSLRALDRVVAEAARLNVKLIVSVHDFAGTPSHRRLETLAARARTSSADVFKLVTRVDTPADLQRLLAAFDILNAQIPVSAMGVGKLGRESRGALIARGSVLNYAHLGAALIDGQLSLDEMRRLARIHYAVGAA